MKIVKITEAKYIDNYKIQFQFNTNETKVIDFRAFLSNTPYNNEKKYLNLENFQKFRVEMGDLIWNDYDMCFQAKNLYKNILRK